MSWLYDPPIKPTLQWIGAKLAARPQFADANVVALKCCRVREHDQRSSMRIIGGEGADQAGSLPQYYRERSDGDRIHRDGAARWQAAFTAAIRSHRLLTFFTSSQASEFGVVSSKDKIAIGAAIGSRLRRKHRVDGDERPGVSRSSRRRSAWR
jgi:hypothetical protein